MYTYIDKIWNHEFTTQSKTAMAVIAVLTLISWWRLFNKAGELGIKSIVPLLNVWTVFKIANSFGSTIGWFLALIIPGVNAIILLIMRWRFASRYTDSFGLRLLYFLFPFIGGLIFAFGDEFQYKPAGLNSFYR